MHSELPEPAAIVAAEQGTQEAAPALENCPAGQSPEQAEDGNPVLDPNDPEGQSEHAPAPAAAYFPKVQLAHEVAPEMLLYCPAAHPWQDPDVVELHEKYCPDEQLQGDSPLDGLLTYPPL